MIPIGACIATMTATSNTTAGCCLNTTTHRSAVEKLLSLGCISSLKEKLEPEAGSRHCFDTPDKDVTVFYGKDRGEKGQEAFTCTEEQLKDPSNWINFIYVFDNDTWYYSEIERDGFSDFRPLAPAIKKIDEQGEQQ